MLNWQLANLPIAGTEPRKLFAPVRSRSKHTSNGIKLTRAQMASPRTRSVPGGSVAYCEVPLAPRRTIPPTEPSASTRPSPDVPSKQVNENRLPTTKLRASSAPMFPESAGTAAKRPATAKSAHTVFVISWTLRDGVAGVPAFARLHAVGLRADHPAHTARWTGVDLWRVRAGDLWRVDLRTGSIGAGVMFGMRCAVRAPAATVIPTAPYRAARRAWRQRGSGRDAHRGTYRRCDAIRGRPNHRGRNRCAIIPGNHDWRSRNNAHLGRRDSGRWHHAILGRSDRWSRIGVVGGLHTKR